MTSATCSVEDFPEAVSAGESPTLRRTLDLKSDMPPENLYLRAIAANRIEPAGEGWYTVDGEWKLRISTDSKPFIRNSAGKAELIVPVKWNGDKARIVEEYAW